VKRVNIEKSAYMSLTYSLLTLGYQRGLVQKFLKFARFTLHYFIFHIKSLLCAIPALHYSSKTQESIKKGDLQAAKKYSRRTFQCNLASNVFALVIFISIIVFTLAYITLSRSRENSNFNGNTTQIYSKTTTSRKF
jgi:hypothetical protein